MKTGSFSRTAKKCQNCPSRDDCENKRLEMCAYIIPEPMATPATMDASMPVTAELLVKHDYRDIKIDANTTITIDLEDIKEQMKRDFYKSLNCNFMQFGG